MVSLLKIVFCVFILCLYLTVQVNFDSRSSHSSHIKAQNNPTTHCQKVPISFVSYSITDTLFIFLSKEEASLVFPDKMYGLGPSRLLYTRPLSLLICICMTSFKCISHFLSVKFFQRHLSYCRNIPPRSILARKIRMCLGLSKRMLIMYVTAANLILLLLCGDVHSNPGPVLPGTTRHPDRQFLVVGSWNVRTLLETKRTPITPNSCCLSGISKVQYRYSCHQ